MKRTRTDDASIEQRVREIINPAFDEWINRKIDSAELDRRRELAHKQATAEHSGSPTAVASWATAAAETGAKSAAEVRCTAIGPASPDVSCAQMPAPSVHQRARRLPTLPLASSVPPHQATGSKGVGLPKRPSESSCHLASNSLSTYRRGLPRMLLPSVGCLEATAHLSPEGRWRAHPGRSTA